VIADVFTRTPFGGNQLAVFYDAQSLSDRAMQVFAQEVNFAESTFVPPPTDPKYACRVRIFTPKRELPFAGHSTIGTAAVLAHLGRVKATTDGIVLEAGIGSVLIEVRASTNPASRRLILEKAVEEPVTKPAPSSAASALSLPDDTVLDTWCASAGIRFTFIHLTNRAAVNQAALNRDT
jgi:trans-2,3-dihydro-3-hydroxyanthranilate isomerase